MHRARCGGQFSRFYIKIDARLFSYTLILDLSIQSPWVEWAWEGIDLCECVAQLQIPPATLRYGYGYAAGPVPLRSDKQGRHGTLGVACLTRRPVHAPPGNMAAVLVLLTCGAAAPVASVPAGCTPGLTGDLCCSLNGKLQTTVADDGQRTTSCVCDAPWRECGPLLIHFSLPLPRTTL